MTCDCEFFNFGDPVRSRQNPHLTGVVVGDRNWGSEYLVRLADGATTIWWHSIEIEHDPDGEPPAKEDDDTNVVKVDFTQRRAMTAETTTEGAA
ncbi:hypothetical protein [Agrobacterium burrii]|uniref:Uncharacterized protein n=1 Tax=Agrobacterium burrii TaxID=2815339 RepID=A0ABS3EBN9_9HYPH|nr:hypothetical protein [Agrobacterium burrii]MBO0129133.1 hypothetical protein [Agrobacterium burrii]